MFFSKIVRDIFCWSKTTWSLVNLKNHWTLLDIVYCLPVWCLLPVLRLLYCMMSSYLYDVCLRILCLPILCLLICVMTAQLNDVCLPVWCLPTCSMSGFLYLQVISCCPDKICIPVWCLSTLPMLAGSLYYVGLHVWCLPTCSMSA